MLPAFISLTVGSRGLFKIVNSRVLISEFVSANRLYESHRSGITSMPSTSIIRRTTYFAFLRLSGCGASLCKSSIILCR